jgi:predicted RNase H-like HicB family nuclease
MQEVSMNIHLVYRAEVFKEDGQFVAICPELNVSSFGDSVEEARKSLREAIDLFLEECESMGTIEPVLRESGFNPDPADPKRWVSRVPLSRVSEAIDY